MIDENVKTGRYIDNWTNRLCFVIRREADVTIKYENGSFTAMFVETFIDHGFTPVPY